MRKRALTIYAENEQDFLEVHFIIKYYRKANTRIRKKESKSIN
jgi:hypothetical protein